MGANEVLFLCVQGIGYLTSESCSLAEFLQKVLDFPTPLLKDSMDNDGGSIPTSQAESSQVHGLDAA